MAATEQKCPRCGAANPAGAKFCSSCGNVLGAPQATAQPQPAATFSSSSGFSGASSSSGFGASGGSGNTRSATFGLDPGQAFVALSQAVTSLGGDITDQSPPNLIRFAVPYKDTWTTLGLTAKMEGEVRITPEPQGGSRATVLTNVNIGSLIPLFIICVVIGIFLFGFGLILGVLVDVYIYYKLNGDVAERLARSILERAAAGVQA